MIILNKNGAKSILRVQYIKEKEFMII